MGRDWITNSGTTGTIQIVNREGDWFLAEPSMDGTVKCVLQGEFDLFEGDTTQTLEVQTTKYMQAAGQGPDYLFVAPDDEEPESVTADIDDSATATTDLGRDTDDRRSLMELSGSGDYVTVEAVVDDILTVAKDESNIPDIIGVLREEDSKQKRMFVVNSGVSHPYLEENRRFVFRNVKDHYYENADKIQVMITPQTQFTEKDLVEPSTQSTTKSSSSQSASTSRSSSLTTNLDKIARSMIGEEEFTVTQKSESAVGQAKKKAKRQQRDPAIDPKLQGGE